MGREHRSETEFRLPSPCSPVRSVQPDCAAKHGWAGANQTVSMLRSVSRARCRAQWSRAGKTAGDEARAVGVAAEGDRQRAHQSAGEPFEEGNRLYAAGRLPGPRLLRRGGP